MDCTARGKGNESRRGDKGGMGWSNSGSDDDSDEDRSPVVCEERNDLWKFPISIILNVRAERYNRGSGVSKDAIMGVKKCYKTRRVKTHRTNQVQPIHRRIHGQPSASC